DAGHRPLDRGSAGRGADGGERAGGGSACGLPWHPVHLSVAGAVEVAGPAAGGGGADLAAPGGARPVDRRWRDQRGLSFGRGGGRGAPGRAPVRGGPVVAAARAGPDAKARGRLDVQAVVL